MIFWSKISDVFRDFPESFKKFIEYSWKAMEWMAAQLYFDAQNALSSMSPEYISVYDIRYWKKYGPPWSVDSKVYSIPTLQDMIYADEIDIVKFEEGVDYQISNGVIVWTSYGVTDGDMEISGVANWTQIGAPTTFQKDGSNAYEGSLCLEVAGVSGDGFASTAVVVAAGEWVRYSVWLKPEAGLNLILYDESNNVEIDTVAVESGSEYANHEVVAVIPDGCTSITLRAVLSGSGKFYADLADLTTYPRDGQAFAEQVLMYNDYLDKKLGYDLRFRSVNGGSYTPLHARQIMRALNYAYRSSDLDEWSLLAGVTAVLGLPFAYYAGIVKSKATASGKHTIVITKDSDGVDYQVQTSSSLCALTDFPEVGASVEAFQPLYGDALKISEVGEPAFIPKKYLNYPTDGDMEAPGVTDWTGINGALLSKDAVEQYAGSQCLKVTAISAGDGVKPSTNKSVTAGSDYVAEFFIKRNAGDSTIVRADVIDVTNSGVIVSEWFGSDDYERGRLLFTAPAGCLNVRIEFIAIQDGVFYVDEIKYYAIEEIKSYWIEKTADSVRASLTIPATNRAGSEDLAFKASSHIYGKQGENIKIVIVASGADQALSSARAGAGTSGDPYIYTLITGNASALQNSNNAIRDFVNSDPNAIGVVICISNDDDTADPTYALAETALAGGVDVEVSTYEETPFAANDIVCIRNITPGLKTVETRRILTVASASSPYSQKFTLSDDLYVRYRFSETGTSTSVGVNTLTDGSKSWPVNEFTGKILVDSSSSHFKILSNTTTVLSLSDGIDSEGAAVTTPAAGAYRIIMDHVVMNYSNKDSGYTNEVVIYNRADTVYLEDNIDEFISNIGDLGHSLRFVDVK